MSTLSIETAPNLENTGPKKGSAKSSAPRRRKVPSAAVTAKKPPKPERAAAAKMPPKADKPNLEGVTKQERMLTLLSRPEGDSIEEITDWQQHSVRGFLAGTVKKKLGFWLATSKAAGDVRRYRIETRRGR